MSKFVEYSIFKIRGLSFQGPDVTLNLIKMTICILIKMGSKAKIVMVVHVIFVGTGGADRALWKQRGKGASGIHTEGRTLPYQTSSGGV